MCAKDCLTTDNDVGYVIMDNDRDQLWTMVVFKHRSQAIKLLSTIVTAYAELDRVCPRLKIEKICFNSEE